MAPANGTFMDGLLDGLLPGGVPDDAVYSNTERITPRIRRTDMPDWQARTAAAALGIAVGLGPTIAGGQEIDVLMALPAATLTFSNAFIAEDAGFYKKEGLKVSNRTIVGVGAVNAVIAGSADFTMGTGPVFLRAAAQGQRLLAFLNLVDKPLVELVLRKDIADV